MRGDRQNQSMAIHPCPSRRLKLIVLSSVVKNELPMSMRCEIQQRRLLVVLVKRLMPNHLKPWPQAVESDVMPIFKEVMLCICINGQHVITPQPKLTCYVQRGPRFVGPTFWYTDRYDKRSGKRRQIPTHDHRGILSLPSRCKQRGLDKPRNFIISSRTTTHHPPSLADNSLSSSVLHTHRDSQPNKIKHHALQHRRMNYAQYLHAVLLSAGCLARVNKQTIP